MKPTLLSLVLIFSFLITPLQSIHGATTTDNTALIQKLLAQIVVLQAELNKLIEAKGGNTTTPTCTFTRTLREGTQGTDVTCLQTYLKKKGHFSGTATGYYGPVTRDAVYKWQQSAGIVPEPTAIGMFGPRSQETFIREMKVQTNTNTNTNTDTTNTTPRTTNGGGGGGGNTPRNTTDTPRATRPTQPVVTNDTTKPTLPTNLTATANSSSQITLSWTASTDAGGSGLKGYNIYRVGTTLPVNSVPQTGTTFTQTGLNPSTAYTYQIEAIDNAGNKSMKTASVSKTTLALSTIPDTTKPTTPGQPTASLVTQTTLKLTWTASTDAGGSNLTGYKLYRNGTQIGTPTTNTYNDANLTANTAYSYTVVAYDGAGNMSATSTVRSVTTLAPVVVPPATNAPPITTNIPPASGNSASWNTLCNQNGIFVCDNFSDRYTGTIYPGFSKAYIENGTIVFTIPSNSNANAGGEYRQDFSAIGEGEFVAFSYRIKADAATLNIDSPGRKEFIMWRGASSCTDLQLVQTHNGSKPVLVPYTDCGARGFTSKIPNSGGNIQWHYPDFDCKYHAAKKGDYTNCAISHADQWENFYVEVKVGNYRQPNSSVTMWYRPDNGDWKRYIATSTYAFNGTGGFEHFMLTVYMTGKDTSIAHPEGKVYYDHLIMSTKPFNADQFIAATVNPITNAAANQSVPASTPPASTPVTPANTTPPPVVVPSGPRTVQVTVPALPAPSSNPASSLTSQISAIPSGTWAKITADNKATDIDPAKDPAINTRHPANAPWHGGSGYKGMFEAWNSGGLATNFGPCGSILHYGGGHNDYWGNQVTALNLCGGASGGPVWQRLSDPYKEIIAWPATDGAYADGTPSPAHTYDTLSFGNNKLMVFNAQSTNGPTHVPSAFVFDLANRTWTGPLTHLGNSHGASAWDSRRSLVWNMPPYTSSGGKFSSFNPATQVFTNYFKTNVSPFVSNVDSMMSYDPDNDKLVVTNFRSSATSMAEVDPANPNTRPVIVSQIGKPDLDQGQHAFAWSPKRHAFIVWMDLLNDGNVWEVKRTGLNASGTPEYVWTLLTDASNSVQPVTTSHNGSYDKFQIVTVGGDEVLIGQLRLSDGIYAFKIPAPGTATRPTKVPLTGGGTKATLDNLLKQLKALEAELKKLKK
jgi:chitodextrinase